MRLAKRNGKRLLALTLALLLCAALLPTAALAETYSGTTVRLEKTEGTVTVKNAAGEVKSLSGRPRLSGGWTVKTEAASYAWLSFDADSGNTLSVKLDANTLVEVRKNGGKNEVLLKNNGRLIAGSEKPLSGGQTLSVGNSSGVCGVRGSLMLATEDQFMFLFGHGVASGRYGSAQQTELAAGQGVFFGAGGSMRRFEVQTAQISGFAQVELAGNPALAQQMYEQTGGRLDLRELTAEQALQQQRTDEARAALLRGGSTAGGLSVPGGSRLRLDPAWGVGGRFNKSTTVYFDANGGTGYMAPVTVTSALPVPACAFTRDGYTFVGWKDDHGRDHPVGSSIQGGVSGTSGEQLTLYAQWQANNPGGGNVLPYVPEPQPQPVPTKYAVTISDGIEHGTVSADKSEAAAGETVTLTATPDGGYLLDGLTVTGASGAVAVSDNKFTMPAEAVAVSATFTQITYPISVASGITGGTVTADKDTAAAGETVTLTATPRMGYVRSAWTVTDADGAAVDVAADGSFTMPAGAVTVSATFTQVCDLTLQSAEGCTVKVNDQTLAKGGKTTLPVGRTVTVALTPQDGYELGNAPLTVALEDKTAITVTPVEGETGVYTFVMPDKAANMSALLTPKTYTLALKDADGNPFTGVTVNGAGVDDNGTATVSFGSTITLEVTNAKVVKRLALTTDGGQKPTAVLTGRESNNNIIVSTYSFPVPADNVTGVVELSDPVSILFRVFDGQPDLTVFCGADDTTGIPLTLTSNGTDEPVYEATFASYEGEAFRFRLTLDGKTDCFLARDRYEQLIAPAEDGCFSYVTGDDEETIPAERAFTLTVPSIASVELHAGSVLVTDTSAKIPYNTEIWFSEKSGAGYGITGGRLRYTDSTGTEQTQASFLEASGGYYTNTMPFADAELEIDLST